MLTSSQKVDVSIPQKALTLSQKVDGRTPLVPGADQLRPDGSYAVLRQPQGTRGEGVASGWRGGRVAGFDLPRSVVAGPRVESAHHVYHDHVLRRMEVPVVRAQMRQVLAIQMKRQELELKCDCKLYQHNVSFVS